MADRPLTRIRLDAADARPAFSCGDKDIDEFFHTDSIAVCKQLLCVTYAMMEDDTCVAFFSVSNDSIKKKDGRSPWERLIERIPKDKRFPSMPAVKIGRLGVSDKLQRSGYGTVVLDFIKFWFIHGNKTGCRFLLVDAYNQERTICFYKRNGFEFFTTEDEKDPTRIMYFDLLLLARAAP